MYRIRPLPFLARDLCDNVRGELVAVAHLFGGQVDGVAPFRSLALGPLLKKQLEQLVWRRTPEAHSVEPLSHGFELFAFSFGERLLLHREAPLCIEVALRR